MSAAVYKGRSVVAIEDVPTPRIGAGEILVRVEACGICHTDLKKIEYDLLAPPRIYGHETAGVVAQIGESVRNFQVGDRVAFRFGPVEVEGDVVEDRGHLGVGGKRLYAVIFRVDDVSDPIYMEYEVEKLRRVESATPQNGSTPIASPPATK